MMDDITLARELIPDDVEQGLAALRKMTPAAREIYERLIWTASELNAGRIPAGVIVKRA